MEPEIARRCLVCGVSVRVHAFFCPQCGNELPGNDPAFEEAKTEPLSPAGFEHGRDISEFGRDGSDSEGRVAPVGVGELNTSVRESHEHVAGRGAPKEGFTERQAIGEVHGVEKLRQISSAVFDEASYDPSLRFVLAAAVLFVLFLILLIASELIT